MHMHIACACACACTCCCACTCACPEIPSRLEIDRFIYEIYLTALASSQQLNTTGQRPTSPSASSSRTQGHFPISIVNRSRESLCLSAQCMQHATPPGCPHERDWLILGMLLADQDTALACRANRQVTDPPLPDERGSWVGDLFKTLLPCTCTCTCTCCSHHDRCEDASPHQTRPFQRPDRSLKADWLDERSTSDGAGGPSDSAWPPRRVTV